MRAAPPSHRLALSPVCWGISDIPDWGHQLDPERVLSEAAAVGEGVITAGPPGFLPDRSDQAKPLLKRNRLRLIAGDVHAILHHDDIRGPELAHIDVVERRRAQVEVKAVGSGHRPTRRLISAP